MCIKYRNASFLRTRKSIHLVGFFVGSLSCFIICQIRSGNYVKYIFFKNKWKFINSF